MLLHLWDCGRKSKFRVWKNLWQKLGKPLLSSSSFFKFLPCCILVIRLTKLAGNIWVDFFKRSHQACILFCLHNYIAQECVLKVTLEKPAKMPQLSVWHFSALLKKTHTQKKLKSYNLSLTKPTLLLLLYWWNIRKSSSTCFHQVIKST